MNLIQRFEFWGDRHHPKWLDILRICLGVFLCIKGVQYAENITSLENMMAVKAPFSSLMVILIGHYIVGAHILGGFLLAMGMLTRFACLIQIPILLGAIVFINMSPEMFRPFSELFLSILVLLLLVYFLIIGSGPWSFDHYNVERKK
ncbi:MAG: DoxX family protein [Flavisolibacter sp.]